MKKAFVAIMIIGAVLQAASAAGITKQGRATITARQAQLDRAIERATAD